MARFPERSYTHPYGNLTVTVKSDGGVYFASVRRPSDGYEATVETMERSPMDAARYALQALAEVFKSGHANDPVLYRAGMELGHDAAIALMEESC